MWNANGARYVQVLLLSLPSNTAKTFLTKPTSVKSTSAFKLEHLKEKNGLQSCPEERFPCQPPAYEH